MIVVSSHVCIHKPPMTPKQDISSVSEKSRWKRSEHVLRDESDEIIDGLKHQLNTLKQQLKQQQHQAENAHRTNQLASSIAPHLASKLSIPAQNLTQRLDKIIAQINVPELREELLRCRQLAYFFYETFFKIQRNHQLLADTLTTPPTTIILGDLAESTAAKANVSSVEVDDAEKSIVVPAEAVININHILSQLMKSLFGSKATIKFGIKTEADGATLLHIDLITENVQPAVDPPDLYIYAISKNTSANHIVDLLYVEKVLSLSGGNLSLSVSQEQGMINGLSIRLPISYS